MILRNDSVHPALSAPEWRAATQRVEKYLRAHRIAPAEAAPLARAIMAEARAKHGAAKDPVTAAMAIAAGRVEAWQASDGVAPKALTSAPEVRLTHMVADHSEPAARRAPSANGTLASKAAALSQRTLLKATHGVVMFIGLLAATWAEFR